MLLYEYSLGKTKITEDRTMQLFNLVDLIYNRKFGLTVTSNFTLSELETRWDENYAGGITRRIQDICTIIYLI